LFEEAKIPMACAGSAIGLVSFIGYSPDVFTGPLFGFLIDQSPGVLGHQHVYGVVALFSVIGIVATILFAYVKCRSLKTT
jgi:sugar phosphate permease